LKQRDLHEGLFMARADIFHDVGVAGTTLKDSYEKRNEADAAAGAYVEAQALAALEQPGGERGGEECSENPTRKASVLLDQLVERRIFSHTTAGEKSVCVG
jgi:hypothetical protein